MAVLGWVFVGTAALAVGAGVALGVMALPDARRYLKLRRM